jgi:preprotein translocase subunit SecF
MVVLIVPIFDTLRVFIVRLINGRSPFKADRNHVHHILIDNGLNHLWASVTLWSVTIINTTLFFAFHGNVSNTLSLWIYMGMFIGYMVTAYFLKRRAYSVKNRKSFKQTAIYDEEAQSFTKKILKNL